MCQVHFNILEIANLIVYFYRSSQSSHISQYQYRIFKAWVSP